MFSLFARPRLANTGFLRIRGTAFRYLSSSHVRLTSRAVVYSRNGDPADVLSVATYPSLPPPAPGTVNIRFLLSPINPADINVIEGVYPSKPSLTYDLTDSGKGSKEEPVFIGGNEGLATVTSVGEHVEGLKVGDWVVMVKQQVGTWLTNKNVTVCDVVKIPDREGLTEVHAATITVNPPTAYNMLTDYVELKEGDWVMQNGANSAVGQAVIQIAAARGLKTLNFVRNRDDISRLKEQLQKLGATQVLTYEDLADKALRSRIKAWTGGKEIRLALNCVGGRETAMMSKFLGRDAHLVSYGAMSKQPLSLPTSAFIFKNLTAHGFWQSRWYLDHSAGEREELMRSLAHTPQHEIVSIDKQDNDEEATRQIREVFKILAAGRHGKKVLLKFKD
ncbi:trans-2-enoyl-CoA reductase [Macrolepiota fuliginosa MF-IS2]|uniref:enoyl-[acyl-carrier-protein] reductase n=1 Tax=Macrolepiota fuliginosa MF-IS2 TaxID=1400762 RepID=A0A9P5XB07_9AGAR|nr:trans-2-enoyl-CoA reductase [Macrolepiota fuliginosa MF-IS2]